MLLRRTRTRASRGGFSLIELMTVVMLIALLSMIAVPSMIRGRSDRLAFSYARTVQEVIHNSRSRAAGRGAAQMVAFSVQFGARGSVFTFEALDKVLPGNLPLPGPGPSTSCRQASQWIWVQGWGSASPSVDPAYSAQLIDGLTINSTNTADVVVTENIKMEGFEPDPGGGSPAVVPAFVLCVTPNGTTYYGKGANVSGAIDAMVKSNPFQGTVEIDIARHDAGNVIVGLNRRVIITGSAAPRIKSE